MSQQQSKEFTFTWTNTLTYNATFGKSRLNVLLGIESVKDDYSTFGAANTNFAIQDVNYFQLSSGSGAQTVNGSATGFRLLSQFGKAFYSYADRYLASVTVRRDGSSRFGTNNPYGVFPAFTLGWRINNEDFFRNIKCRFKSEITGRSRNSRQPANRKSGGIHIVSFKLWYKQHVLFLFGSIPGQHMIYMG